MTLEQWSAARPRAASAAEVGRRSTARRTQPFGLAVYFSHTTLERREGPRRTRHGDRISCGKDLS
jgi:hypothetical protein